MGRWPWHSIGCGFAVVEAAQLQRPEDPAPVLITENPTMPESEAHSASVRLSFDGPLR